MKMGFLYIILYYIYKSILYYNFIYVFYFVMQLSYIELYDFKIDIKELKYML